MNLEAERNTKETRIKAKLVAGGEPTVRISWAHHGGIDEAVDEGMARHLYTALLRYARLGGELSAEGDLCHHVVEDTAIVLGQLFGEAASGEVRRFADRTVAMDEALVQVALDAGGRAFYASDLGGVSKLWHHALRSLAFEAKFTLHIRTLAGADPHHVIEAAVKGLGLCLADALLPSDRLESTKGHAGSTSPQKVGRQRKAAKR